MKMMHPPLEIGTRILISERLQPTQIFKRKNKTKDVKRKW